MTQKATVFLNSNGLLASSTCGKNINETTSLISPELLTEAAMCRGSRANCENVLVLCVPQMPGLVCQVDGSKNLCRICLEHL